MESISEVIGTPGIQPPGMGGGSFVAGAPSISPGQLSYRVQVQVTFGIR